MFDSCVRPTLDIHGLVGVEVDHVLALCVQITKERFFPTAEVKKCHRRCSPGVYTEVPNISAMSDRTRIRPATSEQARRVSKVAPIDHLDCLVKVGNR
jgi:hypothetical protein